MEFQHKKAAEPEAKLTRAEKVRRYVRRGLGVAGITLASTAGGVIATQAHPPKSSFEGITIQSQFSLNPKNANHVSTDTVVGTAAAKFDSTPLRVPGLTTNIQVTPEVEAHLDTFKDVAKNPDKYSQEFTDIAREQAEGIVKDFLVGSGVTAAGLSLGIALLSEKDRRRRTLAAAGAGIVGMVGLPALSANVYWPTHYEELQTTGILAQAVDTPNAVEAISTKQGQESWAYLQGWLAVTNTAANTLKNNPETNEVGEKGPRFLFVSDIHGNNDYALMKQIVKNEDIDAVIDTGDFLNFGHVQEAEQVKMFEGIKSLDVPYLFVYGNHDRYSADDTSLLDRMAKVPNVHLLQPSKDELNVVTVDGVRIAGVNDMPRYYGDGIDSGPAYKKAAKTERDMGAWFNGVMKTHQPIDIALTHEPDAGKAMDGTIDAFGHTHSYSFDGKHLNTGTFSGGDPFRTTAERTANQKKLTECLETSDTPGDCKATEHPQNFVVIQYDESCNPQTLKSVIWRNGDGGVYYSKSVVESINQKAGGDDRSCTVDGDVSTEHIQLNPTGTFDAKN